MDNRRTETNTVLRTANDLVYSENQEELHCKMIPITKIIQASSFLFEARSHKFTNKDESNANEPTTWFEICVLVYVFVMSEASGDTTSKHSMLDRTGKQLTITQMGLISFQTQLDRKIKYGQLKLTTYREFGGNWIETHMNRVFKLRWIGDLWLFLRIYNIHVITLTNWRHNRNFRSPVRPYFDFKASYTAYISYPRRPCSWKN